MKKLVSVLLCIALLCCCAVPALAGGEYPAEAKRGSFGAYEHVFIIGVDGAVTYSARAEIITTSAQNWGSILTGVSYLRHKMTNDSISENDRDSDTQYPSLFYYARQAFPEAALASFVHWDPINYGIIENDIDALKMNGGDDEVADAIAAYLDGGNAPKLLFCQLDDVDHEGHDTGSKSEAFLAAVTYADGQLGRIYDAVERNGLMENSLFIVVSDHGHSIAGGHGAISSRETDVTVAVKGKTVVSGGQMDKDTRNRDVSAITLYALGIERPEYMSSRLPADLFENTAGEKRDLRYDFFDAFFGAITGAITGVLRWLDV